jgi:GNAT superfamily N-acetyltransferase
MEYPLLSLELAREIEMAEAEAAVGCAERLLTARGDEAGAVASVGGGYAIYCGANSPVTQAVGLGLNGSVAKEEFDRLEEFYFGRKEPVRVETCPMADGSLIEQYRERGYHVSEFSNVMVRPVEKADAAALSAGIEIHKAADGEIDLWTLTVSQGFVEHYPVTKELLDIMRLFASGKNTECYFARVEGKIAGGATLALRGRIAGLFGASTLPQFRNRGVQTALLNARMQRAAERGCELAMSIALPGSASQRNITRQGFRTLYTRVKFERQVGAGTDDGA